MKNTDISKLLGQHWKALPLSMRQPYIDREHREREAYKTKIAEWREERKKLETLSRQQREAVATQYANSGCGIFPPPPPPPGLSIPKSMSPSVPPPPRNPSKNVFQQQWGSNKSAPFVNPVTPPSNLHYYSQDPSFPPSAITAIYQPPVQSSSLYPLPVMSKKEYYNEEKSAPPEEPASIAEMLEGQRGGLGGKLAFNFNLMSTGMMLLSCLTLSLLFSLSLSSSSLLAKDNTGNDFTDLNFMSFFGDTLVEP